MRGPCGEPSSLITLALSPVSSSKCSAGLAMVAEVAMKTGLEAGSWKLEAGLLTP